MKMVDQNYDSYALEINSLWAAYEKSPVIYDIDLKIPQGKIVGVIGPNGAGKSTLIKAILGLIPKSYGVIKIFGQPIKKSLKRIGYVPQRESIDWDFPVTVFDVVMMGRYNKLGIFKRPKKEDHEAVMHCLERVGMQEFYDRQISNLSGGQQQRIFLARALAQNADLYFMDEPFSAVDARTEQAIISVLHELRSAGKTLIIIHHDLSTAKKYFDYIVLINRQIVASGPTDTTFTLPNLERTYEGHLHVLHTE